MSSLDDEAAEKVEVIDVLCALGYGCSDGAGESNDVDEDTSNVGGKAAPMETITEVVGTSLESRVKIADLKVAFADPIVVANHDASDRRQEDRIC